MLDPWDTYSLLNIVHYIVYELFWFCFRWWITPQFVFSLFSVTKLYASCHLDYRIPTFTNSQQLYLQFIFSFFHALLQYAILPSSLMSSSSYVVQRHSFHKRPSHFRQYFPLYVPKPNGLDFNYSMSLPFINSSSSRMFRLPYYPSAYLWGILFSWLFSFYKKVLICSISFTDIHMVFAAYITTGLIAAVYILRAHRTYNGQPSSFPRGTWKNIFFFCFCICDHQFIFTEA